MIRLARPLVIASAAALLGFALAMSPLGASAQTQPTAPAAKAEKKPMMKKAPAKMEKKAMPAGAKKPMGISRRGVEIVQAALNNAGYKVDIDGYLGPKTREVLKKYQADHKLKATGAIDRATLKSLNVKSLRKWG
jgi:peptidoglycan hydrolase-like protein with peptidoglycan-binding domain